MGGWCVWILARGLGNGHLRSVFRRPVQPTEDWNEVSDNHSSNDDYAPGQDAAGNDYNILALTEAGHYGDANEDGNPGDANGTFPEFVQIAEEENVVAVNNAGASEGLSNLSIRDAIAGDFISSSKLRSGTNANVIYRMSISFRLVLS